VTGYIARRLLALIPLLLLISFFVFAMAFVIPGDPAITLAGGLRADPAHIKEVRTQLGFDKPVVTQYGNWLGNALRGDLGDSILRKTSVTKEIRTRFPVTAAMAIGALGFMVLVGVPVGIASATRQGSLIDRAATVGTSTAIALPDFWLAMILVVVFAVKLKWLPAISYVPFKQSPLEWARHLLMPWIALGLAGAASLARQLRASLIDVLDADYIRTAAAKGLRGRMIIGKHALKNAAIVPVTVLGIQFAYLLGGTVVLEQIFSIPGIGQYFFLALNARDLPVIQGVTLIVALTFVLLNLFVDVLYAYINPKVRLA
jgi:peptide/nickel transport system permease protein